MKKLIKTNIDEAISKVVIWKGKKIDYAPVPGGITNPNYKVTVDGKNFFLKIPGAGTDAFIDRDNCHIANVLAMESGAGPVVTHYFQDTGVEIWEWLEGYRTATWGDMYNKDTVDLIAKAAYRFHNCGKTLPLRQTLFEQTWQMIDLAKEGGYEPPWHDRFLFLLKEIEEAVLIDGIDYKPCHNDFWSNNFVLNDATKDFKMIDFEYASMNDPYNDLGCWAAINYFSEEMDVYLSNAYHGGWDEKGFAKIKLYKIIADIKWGYWALQQVINSDVKFDFMNWWGIKIGRLQHFMIDPRVDIWLNLLRGKPVFRQKTKSYDPRFNLEDTPIADTV